MCVNVRSGWVSNAENLADVFADSSPSGPGIRPRVFFIAHAQTTDLTSPHD